MGDTGVDPAEKRGFSSWWWWRFRDVAMGWMKYKIGVTNKYIEWARQRQTVELPDFQACNDNKCNGAFFSLSNDVAWCWTQDWHGVASSCYKQGVRCNKASNGAPSLLSNIVSCGSTHLCDTRMEHVKRLRQDQRGGWKKEKKGEE